MMLTNARGKLQTSYFDGRWKIQAEGGRAERENEGLDRIERSIIPRRICSLFLCTETVVSPQRPYVRAVAWKSTIKGWQALKAVLSVCYTLRHSASPRTQFVSGVIVVKHRCYCQRNSSFSITASTKNNVIYIYIWLLLLPKGKG